MENVARNLLWPTNPNVLLRVVFLYVGQGSSTILIAADGAGYKTYLLDINLDEERGGIDVPALMSDLLAGDQLEAFINSHPHDDHLRGLDKLQEAVSIANIWHSGHIPGKSHEDVYAVLVDAMTNVEDAGGEVVELDSSRSNQPLGDVECYVLAPAKHVQDAIDAPDEAERDARIHEYCVVLRAGIGDTWVMLPGDADRDAWECNITEYWSKQGKIQAAVLNAPHHGSRSFFKHSEDDAPYLEGLQAIDPKYVVISAPKREASPHGHPHKDAVKLYVDQVIYGDNVMNTGDQKYSFICDIYRDGETYYIDDDAGDLAIAYPLGKDGDKGDGGTAKSRGTSAPATIRTRIDDRPMGSE